MNTINVNDLLDNLDNAPKEKNVGKKPKQDNDWDEDEDTGFALGKDQTNAASKAKTTKKKTTTKGWGEVKQEEPKVEQTTAPVQDTQKKGIMKLPNRDAKATAAPNVDLGGELFPELGGMGQPTKKKDKKPEPVPVKETPAESKPAGPLRFSNAKKTEKGEHFVPLDPNLAPKVIPQVVEQKEQKEEKPQTQTQSQPEKVETAAPKREAGFFKRNEEPVKEIIPEDSKFKFGEGPKKFVGAQKISFKREEEKSELEEMRLKKEREVEARLQKERDEAAKEREQWKAAKEQKKEEQAANGTDEKKPAKFSNHKKEGEPRPPKKVAEEKPKAPVEKPAEIKEEETKPSQPVEKIEVTGTLSKKGWGDGAILKKPAKK